MKSAPKNNMHKNLNFAFDQHTNIWTEKLKNEDIGFSGLLDLKSNITYCS